eukprot:Platyproteum_vivax@DN11722_c0_g1_i1.p2
MGNVERHQTECQTSKQMRFHLKSENAHLNEKTNHDAPPLKTTRSKKQHPRRCSTNQLKKNTCRKKAEKHEGCHKQYCVYWQKGGKWIRCLAKVRKDHPIECTYAKSNAQ